MKNFRLGGGVTVLLRSISLALAFFGAMTNPGLGADLIASYPFAGSAIDGTGNGHDGTAYGCISVPDRFGVSDRAYFFDGIDDYVAVPDCPELNPASGIVVEAWVYPTEFGGPEPDDQILMKEAQYQLNIGSDSLVSFGIGPHPWTHAYSINKIPLNQWTHIRGEYSFATGILNFFINGILEGTAVRPLAGWTNQGILFVGKNPKASTGYYFTGQIDDVHILEPCATCLDRMSDLNCDGIADVFDVIASIEHVFSGAQIVPCCDKGELCPQ